MYHKLLHRAAGRVLNLLLFVCVAKLANLAANWAVLVLPVLVQATQSATQLPLLPAALAVAQMA